MSALPSHRNHDGDPAEQPPDDSAEGPGWLDDAWLDSLLPEEEPLPDAGDFCLDDADPLDESTC